MKIQRDSPKFLRYKNNYELTKSRWWFQIFFIFTPTWGNDPVWLIFFKWVETTNQKVIPDDPAECQRCCKMLQDGDATAWRRASIHPRSVQSRNVIFFTTTETCVKIENHHVLLCTITYPTSVFEWLSPQKKTDMEAEYHSLKGKSNHLSKPIFGFHVSFRGGVDIIVGIVKFNFVAWNSTPSNGRQSTGLEKKRGKTPTLWSTWGWEGTLKGCSNGFGQVWLWHDFIEILNKMMAKRNVTFNFQLWSKLQRFCLPFYSFLNE